MSATTKAGRPTTRTVIREEITAILPGLIEQILAATTGKAPATLSPMTPALEAPKVQAPATLPKDAKGTERPPEGGYATHFEVVPATAVGETRPMILRRGRKVAIPEEILSRNVNIYFWNATSSVKPVPQARTMLVEAGFRFTECDAHGNRKGGAARWYGPSDNLPAFFNAGRVARRSS